MSHSALFVRRDDTWPHEIFVKIIFSRIWLLSSEGMGCSYNLTRSSHIFRFGSTMMRRSFEKDYSIEPSLTCITYFSCIIIQDIYVLYSVWLSVVIDLMVIMALSELLICQIVSIFSVVICLEVHNVTPRDHQISTAFFMYLENCCWQIQPWQLSN